MQGKYMVLIILVFSIVAVIFAWYFLKDVKPTIDQPDPEASIYEIIDRI